MMRIRENELMVVLFRLLHEEGLEVMRERYQRIAYQYWVQNKSLEQIAGMEGVTSKRIGDILDGIKMRMLNKLRECNNNPAQLLRYYVDLEEQAARIEQSEGIPTNVAEILNCPIEVLPMSVRVYNCLKAAKAHTLALAIEIGPVDLLKFRNFGKKSLYEVEELLARYGVDWSYKPDAAADQSTKEEES